MATDNDIGKCLYDKENQDYILKLELSPGSTNAARDLTSAVLRIIEGKENGIRKEAVGSYKQKANPDQSKKLIENLEKISEVLKGLDPKTQTDRFMAAYKAVSATSWISESFFDENGFSGGRPNSQIAAQEHIQSTLGEIGQNLGKINRGLQDALTKEKGDYRNI